MTEGRTTPEFVREAVTAILDRLNEPGHRLELAALSSEREGTDTSAYQATLNPPSSDMQYFALYPLTVDAADAAVVLASQIQDAFVEQFRGRAIPPCPSHRHPLTPTNVNSRPVWVCPKDPHHHSELILHTLIT